MALRAMLAARFLVIFKRSIKAKVIPSLYCFDVERNAWAVPAEKQNQKSLCVVEKLVSPSKELGLEQKCTRIVVIE